MNIWQLGLVLVSILIVGYLGFKALSKSIQALGPVMEAAILKRGEERVVILKNQGVSVRNSTGYVWEETIELEPSCTLIAMVEDIVRYYNARGHLNDPPSHADWLWVEMVKAVGTQERVLIARMAEFPRGVSLQRPASGTLESVATPSSGNGDRDHEPVLAAVELSDSTR